ncbi:MAG: allantoate amidohydrolase [Betaproteobacteria bacterium]
MTPVGLPSGTRIVERCDALARLSEAPGALTRVYLSKEQRAVDDLVLAWMQEAGMSAHLDAIGNVVGRYEGATPAAPCLMLGSHLDTVRDAGRFDGMLGVVSAIECVHMLNAGGLRLPHAIEVLGFADEEGVRFGATLLGSRAVAGTFDSKVLDLADANGIVLRDALERFGLDPDRIGAAARPAKDVLAYAELHIEQGPVLEAAGLPVGVVTAIIGANRLTVDLAGMAGHAGTVPMNLRRDALAAAAECVLALEARCTREPDLVGTVGRLDVAPGAINVIPGHVRFTIDIRAPGDEARDGATADVVTAIMSICATRNVKVDIRPMHVGKTTRCAPWLQQQIADAVAAEALTVHRLPSGAGHDGMAMVDLADVGMLFVRCKGGISHNPLESITVEDAAVSASVFLRFIENFKPRPMPK